MHTGVVLDQLSGAPPLWVQVLEDLRRRIAAGEFDDHFPSDLELVSHYGVSRHTAREAVRRLQSDGVLERRRGLGSFVVQAQIEQPLGALYSLFRSIEEKGVAQESIVRALEEVKDDEAATQLECVGESLVYLERLRLAGGVPIALDCSWMPASIARPLLGVDFHHTALYEELAARCRVQPTAGWERLRPARPDKVQSKLLGVGLGESAFAVERFTYWHETPLEWRHSLVRGDRFCFVARWSANDLGARFESECV